MSPPEIALAPTPTAGPNRSRASIVVGRGMTFLVVAFLLFDLTIKLLVLEPAVKGTAELGYPAGVVFWLGVVELVCLALYLVPRTAPLGALLWTGYLGGAVATHVRLGNPLFSHTLFPLYVAVFLWLPLSLRDPRVRALLAPRP